MILAFGFPARARAVYVFTAFIGRPWLEGTVIPAGSARGRPNRLPWLLHQRPSVRRLASGGPSAGASDALVSGVCDRLPTLQPLCEQLGALAVVAAVQDVHVPGVGPQVDTGRPGVSV